MDSPTATNGTIANDDAAASAVAAVIRIMILARNTTQPQAG